MINILPGIAANGLSQNSQPVAAKATASQTQGFARALEQVRQQAGDPEANLPTGLEKILAASSAAADDNGMPASDSQIMETLAGSTDTKQPIEQGASSAGFWLLDNPLALVPAQAVAHATGQVGPSNGLNRALQLAGLQHQVADLLQKPEAVTVVGLAPEQRLAPTMPAAEGAISLPPRNGNSEIALSDPSALTSASSTPTSKGTATPAPLLPENQAWRGFTASAQDNRPITETRADALFTGVTQAVASGQLTETGNSQPGPLQIASVFGSPQWRSEFEQQVMGMAMRGEKQVALHLNPRELGPLVIDLKVVDNQAQIHFLSHHANVRNAVEQALPQLRELLDGQGIALGDTSVSGQSENRHQHSEQQDSGRSMRRHFDEDQVVQGKPAAVISVPSEPDGRVNLYI